jgi:hypothetical protein
MQGSGWIEDMKEHSRSNRYEAERTVQLIVHLETRNIFYLYWDSQVFWLKIQWLFMEKYQSRSNISALY